MPNSSLIGFIEGCTLILKKKKKCRINKIKMVTFYNTKVWKHMFSFIQRTFHLFLVKMFLSYLTEKVRPKTSYMSTVFILIDIRHCALFHRKKIWNLYWKEYMKSLKLKISTGLNLRKFEVHQTENEQQLYNIPHLEETSKNHKKKKNWCIFFKIY